MGRRTRTALLLCLVVLPLVVADMASARAPRPGARYDGKSGAGKPVFLRASRDGNTLSDYFLVARMRCTDGRRRSMGFSERGEPPIPINLDQRFSFADDPFPLTYRARNGDRVRGTSTFSFNGQFGIDETLAGTMRAVFRSKRFDCDSGEEPYTTFLDGTRGAPYRTSRMATGVYKAKGRRLIIRGLRAFAPRPELRRIKILWRVRCRNGTGLRFTDTFAFYPLRRSAATIRARASNRIEPGVFSVSRAQLRIRFFRRGGVYRVRGSWRVRTVVRRGRRQVDTCRTGVRRFSGRFRRGPKNRF